MSDYKLRGINLNFNVKDLPQSAPVTESVTEELKKNAHKKDYLPIKDLYLLREAVADYNCLKNGICCSGEGSLVVSGSKEIIFILQYVFYGDLVIHTLSCVSYAPQIQIIGRHRWLYGCLHLKRITGAYP